MYLQHFGFKEKPFGITPDPDFLYFSEKHTSALAMLEYGLLEQSGITVITGDVGAGKTTLLRHLLRRIEESNITVGLISNVHESLGTLLNWIAFSFDLPHEGLDNVQLFRDLQRFFIEQYAQVKRVVIILDEAQNLDPAALEELRMLTNINADKDHLLQLGLVGQPQLLTLLSQPQMMQIAQRVTAEYHLEPLSLEETGPYINHRVKVAAGQTIELFDDNAVASIYYLSGGVPRLINTLCDHSLVLAYAAGVTTVDFDTVRDAAKHKRIGGVKRFCEPLQSIEELHRALEENVEPLPLASTGRGNE